jgi:hypothetical protein
MFTRVDRFRWSYCFANVNAQRADTPQHRLLAGIHAREADHVLASLYAPELAMVIGEQYTPHPMSSLELQLRATHQDLRRRAIGALGRARDARADDPYQAWVHAQLDLMMLFLEHRAPKAFPKRSLEWMKRQLAQDRSLSPSDPQRPLTQVSLFLSTSVFDWVRKYEAESREVTQQMLDIDFLHVR